LTRGFAIDAAHPAAVRALDPSRFVTPSSARPSMPIYPRIDTPGSFPICELTYGPAFRALFETLSATKSADLAEKFAIDWRPGHGDHGPRPVRPKDGNIHTDQQSKIITVLIYMNSGGKQTGGCLRLLCAQAPTSTTSSPSPAARWHPGRLPPQRQFLHGHKPFHRRAPCHSTQLGSPSERIKLYEVLRHRALGLAEETARNWRQESGSGVGSQASGARGQKLASSNLTPDSDS